MIHRTAAVVAATALFELFPGIQLLGERRTSLGFSYDFLSSETLPAEAEVLIEERMRQMIREKRPICVLEMVPRSAQGLLYKEGHSFMAEDLPEEGLVDMARIGSFHILCAGALADSTAAIGAFKLWKIRRCEEGFLRLSGCAFSARDELKKFLKQYKHYPENSHASIGLQQSLWVILDRRTPVWLEAGLRLRGEVLHALRCFLGRFASEVFLEPRSGAEGGRGALHAAIGVQYQRDAIFEVYQNTAEEALWDEESGFFERGGGEFVQASFSISFGKQREKWISFLQSIAETLSILGFQYSLLVSGGRKRKKGSGLGGFLQDVALLGVQVEESAEASKDLQLDFLVEDALERRWAAFSIKIEEKGVYLTASVERLVALLIENKRKTKREQH